ncbi:LPS export ABC transporter permease LptF [Neisseria animalis]|uniref:Lipopolysaccharide export system permease protein LptF n=1 Tax=Neisseria animalis TaxID=492 RepID=A0A5P3MPG8_NEIAN|nr:LPS export ABC transporter permease LptF [Neisseria animalis]QEY23437.1 LPS export ABC transporter permease LptF [Neisseria animalis]ROW33283.1 LPS export ABC transporter permease LptF [Neisseria animalis]VEE08933.1 putative permease, YjgP/YjgQ family [Neisseria animalis]
MIYQRNFIKELSFAAVGVFVVLLAVLVSTQAINLLGRAADGRVATEAVLALVGFWVIGMTPLLLVLTAFISTLTVLTRYWRDSEMSVWLSCGLALRQWIKPVMQFAVPFSLLIAVMQLWVMPWAELRSREYAELLKQKQELSLVEAGTFNSLGKRSDRVYFVETFDAGSGVMKNLFLREQDEKGNDTVVFAKEGNFSLEDNKRTLELRNGYRYSGTPGRGDYNQVSFEKLNLIISTTPKIVDPISHRRTIPTEQLVGSSNPQHRAELMWRVSLPISVLLLCLLAVPLSYFNPRTGHTYNILIAIGMFLIYQNGLTLLRRAVEDGSIPFVVGLLPMHVLVFLVAVVLLRVRSMPAQPFWQAVGKSLTLKGGK